MAIKLKVVDMFSGLEGWSAAFKERGHDIFTIDFDANFQPDLVADILDVHPYDFPWQPDIILASPPCNTFSVMSIRHYWIPMYQPKNEKAEKGIAIVKKTIELIDALKPKFWLIENPMGVLRKLDFMQPLERRMVTYCQLGMPYMKPTDLWGGFPPSLDLPKPCKNGAPCHIRAVRGSKTGIQGDGFLPFTRGEGGTNRWVGDIDKSKRTGSWVKERQNLSAMRAKVPYDLSLLVCEAAERDNDIVKPTRPKFRGGMIEDMIHFGPNQKQRKDLSALRAKIPYNLSSLVCEATERDIGKD